MKSVDHSSIGRKTANTRVSETWPLRIVVFGELGPRNGSDHSNSGEPQSHTIDKESFNEVMSKTAGDLHLRIRDSNTLISENQWIRLPLRSLRSFHPDEIVEAVPDLRELLAVRKRLAELTNGKISFEQFQSMIKDLREGSKILEKLQEIEPVSAQKPKIGRKGPVQKRKSTAEQKEDLVDSILGMVDLPGDGRKESSVPATRTEIKNLISGIGKSGATGKSVAARKIMHELDGTLSGEVERILHYPAFRRLEALWRGLKLLVDRTDFREPIRIEIRSCAKENLPDSFALFVNQVESGGGLDSDTIVLAIYEFSPSSQDLKILRQLSEMAEALRIPVISSVGLDFFGFDSAREFERMTELGAVFDQAQYRKWRALRKAESSRWLTLLFNRFLLRYTYGPDQVRVKSFNYSEANSASPSNKYLWGNPVWGIGCLLTKQFAASGNCLDITGWDNGLIEDLPIREVQFNSGDAIQSPVEAHISEDLLADLAGEGIAALVSKMNTDSAAILSAPTMHLPGRYSNLEETRQAKLRALLPYQLFVSRIAICAGRLAEAIDPGFAPDTLGTLIKEILLEFVPGRRDIEALTVNVKDSAQFPDRYDVTLTLEPERAGWRLPPIQMQLLIRR